MNPQHLFILKTARPRTLAKLAGVLIPALHLLAATMAGADTFYVINNGNSGSGSLRQAILDSNADDTGAPHRIEFYIESGAKSIGLITPLPQITRSVTIDARTQPGFNGSPLIELNGNQAGASACGLVVNNAALTVHALIINRFGADGIRVDTPDEEWKSCELNVYGCWIGVNAFGNLAAPNGGHGIHLLSSSYTSVHNIGAAGAANRNVISGNTGDGIHMSSELTSLTRVYNNYIGVGANGLTIVGNGGNGVKPYEYYFYQDIPFYPFIERGVNIGSPATGTGNVISGNGGSGIHVPSGPHNGGPYIYGNLIGTDAGGTVDCGNGAHGIFFAGTRCSIAHNTISGNSGSGIRYEGLDTTIWNNYIGTNAIGGSLGNGQHGIHLIGSASADDAIIQDCVIGNNGLRGISIEGGYQEWRVQGCHIGLTPAGTAIGNLGDGIHAANANPTYDAGGIIGRDRNGSGTPNKIAFNGGAGVRVIAPTQTVAILGNEIWNNGGLGIDLGTSGVTPNDPGDADSGPNELQNFPVITLVTPNRVAGTVTGNVGHVLRVEVFISAPDLSGYGEARTYLGATEAEIPASGVANFVVAGLSLAPGSKITATATQMEMRSEVPDIFGNEYTYRRLSTSEFSQIATAISQDTGDFRMASATASVNENAGSVTLTVERTGGSYGAASVAYATSGGTAGSGVDFSAQSGVVQFANGQTSRTISIPIINDSSDEPDESFTVTLSNPAGGPQVIGNPAATVTILDEDDPPTISIDSRFIKEGNVGTTPMVFTVSLSAPSAFPVSVNWVSVDQTATHTIDYSGGGSGSLSFSPGETQKTIAFSLIGDLTQETNESFQVVLQSPSNATLGTGSGTGTILDDDSPGAIQFAASGYSIAEASGTGLTIFVFRNGGGGPVTVDYAVTGGSATPGDDYSSFNMSGTLAFGSGETVKQITVSPFDDILVEGNETIIISLSNPTGGATLGGASTTTVTITDDDTAVTLHGRVHFDNGTPLAGVTVTLDGSASASVTTDSNGFYLFENLPVGGSYTVTPTSEGYYFNPESRSFPNLSNSLLDQNFTVDPGAPPPLYIANNGNGTITLTWPAPSTGWMLERSTTLDPNSWQLVIIPPQTIGEWKSLVLPISEENEFFRLKRP
jgi:hypothetical protein